MLVFLRCGIGISSGWSSSLFTRPLCGSKNPKRSKAAPRASGGRTGEERAGGASVAGIYTPRRRGRPRAIFFQPQPRATPAASVSLPFPPPPFIHLSPFCPSPKFHNGSRRPVSLAPPPPVRLYTERWTNNNKYIFPGRVANPVRGGTSMRARTGIA